MIDFSVVVLPVPGGPESNTLCPPHAIISSARFIAASPAISARSRSYAGPGTISVVIGLSSDATGAVHVMSPTVRNRTDSVSTRSSSRGGVRALLQADRQFAHHGVRVDLEFIVLGEAAIAAEPGEGALDHPAARQDDEALHVVGPLHDLHAQGRHGGDRGLHLMGILEAQRGHYKDAEKLVRQALAYALDRKSVVDTFYAGRGQVASADEQLDGRVIGRTTGDATTLHARALLPAGGHQLRQVTVDEREQQRRDVVAVRVGVGEDDDLAVAELVELEVLAEAAAERIVGRCVPGRHHLGHPRLGHDATGGEGGPELHQVGDFIRRASPPGRRQFDHPPVSRSAWTGQFVVQGGVVTGGVVVVGGCVVTGGFVVGGVPPTARNAPAARTTSSSDLAS